MSEKYQAIWFWTFTLDMSTLSTSLYYKIRSIFRIQSALMFRFWLSFFIFCFKCFTATCFCRIILLWSNLTLNAYCIHTFSQNHIVVIVQCQKRCWNLVFPDSYRKSKAKLLKNVVEIRYSQTLTEYIKI